MAFFSTSTGCLRWAETGLCSGRGVCVLFTANASSKIITEPNVAYSQCVCEPGWTGAADWVNTHGMDCAHPVIFVLFCYCLQFLISAICLSVVIFKLILSATRVYRNYREENNMDTNIDGNTTFETSRSLWKTFFKIKLVRISLIAVWTPLFSLIICILRLQSGGLGYTIGDTVSTTILRALIQIDWWAFAVYYLHSWIILSLHIANVIQRQNQTLFSLLNFYYCLGIIGAAVTASTIVIFLFLSQSLALETQNLLTFIFIHTMICSSGLAAWTSVLTGKKVVTLLTQEKHTLPSDQQKDRAKAITTLDFLMKNFRSAGFQNVVFGLLFAYWPWLRAHYMYFQILQNIFQSVLIFIAVRSLHPPPRINKQSNTPHTSRTSRRLNPSSQRNLPGSPSASPISTPQFTSQTPNPKSIEELEKELYLIIPRFHTPSSSRRFTKRKPSRQEPSELLPRPSSDVLVGDGVMMSERGLSSGGLSGLMEIDTPSHIKNRNSVEVQLTVFSSNNETTGSSTDSNSSSEKRISSSKNMLLNSNNNQGTSSATSSTPTSPSASVTSTAANTAASTPTGTVIMGFDRDDDNSSENNSSLYEIGGLRRSVTKPSNIIIPMASLKEFKDEVQYSPSHNNENKKHKPNSPSNTTNNNSTPSKLNNSTTTNISKEDLELSIQLERSARLTLALRTPRESMILTIQKNENNGNGEDEEEEDEEEGERVVREEES